MLTIALSLEGWSLSDKIAAIIGIVGFLQFVTLVATFLVMDRSAKRQLRAYLAIKTGNLLELRVGKIPSAAFSIHNTGQTPAYNVGHLSSMFILPFPLPSTQGDLVAPVPGLPVPDQTLHPGGMIECVAVGDEPLSAEGHAMIMEGSSYRIHMAGIIFYRDTFGIRRKTKFCAFLDGDQLKRVASAKKEDGERRINWGFTHAHNKAT